MSAENSDPLRGFSATYASVFYLQNEDSFHALIDTMEGRGAVHQGELLAEMDLRHSREFNQPRVGLDADTPLEVRIKNAVVALAYEKRFRGIEQHIWEEEPKSV